MSEQSPLEREVELRAATAAQAWQSGARLSGVRPLSGGASSLTFLADLLGVPGAGPLIVLKVAPPGLPPVLNRDVLRQGRLLRALHGQPEVVVPQVLFDEPGDPPATPPLVAMSFVPGECVEPGLVAERDSALFPQVRARALHAAQVLAAIHAVDPLAAGLSGEPVVSLQQEIDRWTRAFATVPADLQGDYQRCAAALHATAPAPLPPVINHGDYRLGNTLCAGNRVTAVIDWEIWSLGDPRIDLSWLAFFTDEAQHPAAPSTAPTGLPTAAELLATYCERRGTALPELAWFDALTRYKEAAATALLLKRGRRSGTLDASLLRMEPALPALLTEAHQLLGTHQ